MKIRFFGQIIMAIDIANSRLNYGGLITTGYMYDTMRIWIQHCESSWTQNSQFDYFKPGESNSYRCSFVCCYSYLRGSLVV